MDQWNERVEQDGSMPRQTERPVQTPAMSRREQTLSERSCAHGRLIDDVLTRNGKRTGKVRCLECRTILDDPYHGWR